MDEATPAHDGNDAFRCSVCGHRESVRLAPLPELPVERCRACGVAHWLPRPAAGDDEVSYGLVDAAEYDARLAPLAAGFAREHARLLRRLARHRPPPARLLEVGCAAGHFLARAHARGYDVTGIEPGGSAAVAAPAQLQGRVRAETIEATSLPEASFDVIVMTQVIEHLLDPVAAMARVASLLAPGGVVYLETPNFDCALRRAGVRRWVAGNVGPGHWHLFHAHGLARLCRDAGLTPIEEWTYFKALGVSGAGRVAGVRLLNRAVRRTTLGNNLALIARRALR